MRNGISQRSWYLLWLLLGCLVACITFISIDKQFKVNATVRFLKINLSSDGVEAQDASTSLTHSGYTPQEAKANVRGAFDQFLFTYLNSVQDKLAHYQQSSQGLVDRAYRNIEELRSILAESADRNIDIQIQVKKQNASDLEKRLELLTGDVHLARQKVERVKSGDVLISTLKTEDLARQRDRISVHERGLAAVFGSRHPRLLSVRAQIDRLEDQIKNEGRHSLALVEEDLLNAQLLATQAAERLQETYREVSELEAQIQSYLYQKSSLDRLEKHAARLMQQKDATMLLLKGALRQRPTLVVEPLVQESGALSQWLSLFIIPPLFLLLGWLISLLVGFLAKYRTLPLETGYSEAISLDSLDPIYPDELLLGQTDTLESKIEVIQIPSSQNSI